MKTFLSSRAAFLLAAAASLTLGAFAQEVTPTPLVSPTPADLPAAMLPATSATQSPVPSVKPADDDTADENSPGTLRRLDEPTPNPGTGTRSSTRRNGVHVTRHGNDRVSVLGETHVRSGEKISGAAVAVLGDVIVDGEVSDDAVCVLGDCTVDGIVHGQVVCVLGDVHLGPQSHVMGDVICVGGGDVARAAGAIVDGRIIHKGASSTLHVGVPLHNWWIHALGMGRPLAIAPGLNFLWIGTACVLAFYLLLAVMFPAGIRRTGDMLILHPVAVIFSAVLSTLALPVIFVLLCITIIGIPVAIFVLPLGILLMMLFGKAAIYGWIGRRITQDQVSLVLAVLIGALIFVLLFFVPILGILLYLVASGLGLGCAVTAMFQREKKPLVYATIPGATPAPGAPAYFAATPGAAPTAVPTPAQAFPPPVTPAAGSPEATSAGVATSIPMVAPATATPVPPVWPPAVPVPPVIVGTPAGFWIRTGALLIDFVLFATIFGPIFNRMHLLPLMLAAYGAVMWKLKESTIGGIICGLRVVRVDGRPLDWTTTCVRALGCFVSMLIVGLGFVWVAFDDDKQSWHDKIAGTNVVRAPRGTSLV